MSYQLPDAFVARIQRQLGDEAAAFLASYGAPRTQGLRLNPLKLHKEDSPVWTELQSHFGLRPIPWCSTGYYYPDTARPGKHPFHQAGLYYIQEPSAMSAAELLQPQPGDTVLDLAAAPGGKTTQIAGMLHGQGLLIANEIHPARAKILAENVERMGITNAVVTSASPQELAARFRSFFDKIMLDAPCSGEGMFRKDPEAMGEWSPDHVTMCAARQTDILAEAARMLRPGGTLAYSTCTFNTEENEQTVHAFLDSHPQFTLRRIERIWPHTAEGEGHFVALLDKTAESGEEEAGQPLKADLRAVKPDKRSKHKKKPEDKSSADAMLLFEAFARDCIPGWKLPPGQPLLFGEQLYWLPQAGNGSFQPALLDGLKVLRPGLHLAAVKKQRIEPAHALAAALRAEQAAGSLDYEADAPEISAYLRGEALPAPGQLAGWCLVTAAGYPLGWAKVSGEQAKNHFPKGLRWPG
ncbi:RsmB/NOP family class I SAM-dependent RNA methyltransferase [Paenibacillus sp. y28]|uniref:RsmB/NOP family class I SAM-dependent RNA methyltransferase n=1 Tax=Paenibacillus sp. y28 TaxID=3129110 RepID=UPI003019C2DD